MIERVILKGKYSIAKVSYYATSIVFSSFCFLFGNTVLMFSVFICLALLRRRSRCSRQNRVNDLTDRIVELSIDDTKKECHR